MALVELCLPLAAPAWPENKQTAPLLSFKWPLFFKFHSGSPRRRREKAKRRKNVVPTFPPPRRHNQQNMAVLCRHVVTSMARGGNIWGEWVFFFSFRAPCVTHRPVWTWTSARFGVLRRPVGTDASAAAFECNFSDSGVVYRL